MWFKQQQMRDDIYWLKTRIIDLDDRLSKMEILNEKLEFQLKCPQKYKIGQVIKEGTVLSIDLFNPHSGERYWAYRIITKDGKQKTIS